MDMYVYTKQKHKILVFMSRKTGILDNKKRNRTGKRQRQEENMVISFVNK